MNKIGEDIYKNELHWFRREYSERSKIPNNHGQYQHIYSVKLKLLRFQTPTVNHQGKIIHRETKEARFFTEFLPNNIPLEMVYIPGGKFMMGTEDEEIERLVKKFQREYFRGEKPQHEVTVPPFFMGKYQITQEQWKTVASLPQVGRKLNPEPSNFKEDNQKNNLPVEQVSWYDAQKFCKRLSRHTGKQYRLPSEAEWEYACRAGTTTPFHFGETITGELANYNARSRFAHEPLREYRRETTPVGQFPPNSFGLYDMHGNVYEWCEDHWHKNYEGAPTDGNVWLFENDNQMMRVLRGGWLRVLRGGWLRVLRGGSWFYDPLDSCSAGRSYDREIYDSNSIGLRVVCSVGQMTQ